MTPTSPSLTVTMRIFQLMPVSSQKPLEVVRRKKALTAREASVPMVKTRCLPPSPVRLARRKTLSLIVRSIGGLVSEEPLTISRPFPAWTFSAAEPSSILSLGFGNSPASSERNCRKTRILMGLPILKPRVPRRVCVRCAGLDPRLPFLTL